MLKQIKDKPTRLALLGNYLENAKATVFRQTQFAEFELRMHEIAEKGQPITGDALANLYLEITKRYYGDQEGVTVVDDYIKHEWSYIPHFYRDFYVFQYATSFTAAEALSSKVLSGDKGATDRYLRFISAGGSKYPIDLLKDAGVDMTTDEPLDLTIKKMNAVMDEMETLLTLYTVELNSVSADVAYIEAQSQGLQVQAANQKLLQSELDKLMRDAGDGAGHDQADMGATSFERDQEIIVVNNEREKLAQIDRALARIADGTYGMCESCGNPIGKMRAMAFPRATLCMTCKQREERR